MTLMTCPPLTQPQLGALAKIACGVETASGITLLCGPSGVGKTTILEHFAADRSGKDVPTCAIRDVAEWLGTEDDLPDVVIADDAHMASEADLVHLLARCRARRPAASLVLAGQGRLLTLVARERRLKQATVLTATILPGRLDDTAAVVKHHAMSPLVHETTLVAIHEIAAGVPGDVKRLLDLADVVAGSNRERSLSPDTIEAIHRRLSPCAA
jgi:type II secretory pathway predicted ATPase ExeA